MSKHRKSWTAAQKQEIIEYAKLHGASRASRNYEVSQVSISKWRKRYEEYGIDGLKRSVRSSEDPELTRLKLENEQLKAILAEKELHIRIQKALLKKKSINRECRTLIAQDFIEQGFPIYKVLKLLKIPSSTFYYQPKVNAKPRGIKKSTHTRTVDGRYIANSIVVDEIKAILSKEFVDYGYRKVTYWLLKYKGYIINEKKVYRLMKENKILNKKTLCPKSPRTWVTELVPQPSVAFEHLEFDIKYIYISGQRRNALLLTVIDVKSRWVLGQLLSWKIDQYDVRKLFIEIFDQYHFPKTMYVRNDNGSQFIAQVVRDFFKEKEVIQEFTKPATPEQNAHIESYHSIIERVICQKYEFDSIQEAEATFSRWIKFYNYERIHSGIDYLSPFEYLQNQGISVESNKLVIA